MAIEQKVKKPRAAYKRDTFSLAICHKEKDDKYSYESNALFKNIVNEFPSKKAAFKAAKTIPTTLEEHDVHIISVSPRIAVKRTEKIKFSM